MAPIQVSARVAIQDVKIRDCFIPKGDTLMTIQASANWDEDLFENGELFNVYRPINTHQAFGNGHYQMPDVYLLDDKH